MYFAALIIDQTYPSLKKRLDAVEETTEVSLGSSDWPVTFEAVVKYPINEHL